MAGERHRHGMGAAWARHAMCESAFSLLYNFLFPSPLNLVVLEHTMKARVVGEGLQLFVNLELDIGELGALSPVRFKPVPFQKEAGWPPEQVWII
jgi:hypothetical protein